jgi:hypothetical protein
MTPSSSIYVWKEERQEKPVVELKAYVFPVKTGYHSIKSVEPIKSYEQFSRSMYS